MASRKKRAKKGSKRSSKAKSWSCTIKRKDGTKGKPVRRVASKKPKAVKVGKRRLKAVCKRVKG